MRAITDAILSLQRFFANVLPAPWDIRTDIETGGAPVRVEPLPETCRTTPIRCDCAHRRGMVASIQLDGWLMR